MSLWACQPASYGVGGRGEVQARDLIPLIGRDEASLAKLVEAVKASYQAEEAVAAGAVPALVALAEAGNTRQREAAMKALSTIASTGGTMRERVVTMGGLDVILKLLGSGLPREKTAALYVLETFAVTDGQRIARRPQVMLSITRLAERGTPRQQEVAAMILKLLHTGAPDRPSRRSLLL